MNTRQSVMQMVVHLVHQKELSRFLPVQKPLSNFHESELIALEWNRTNHSPPRDSTFTCWFISLCCRMDLAHRPGLHHHAQGPLGGAQLHDDQQLEFVPHVHHAGSGGASHNELGETQRHAFCQRSRGDPHGHKDAEGHHRPWEPHVISQQKHRWVLGNSNKRYALITTTGCYN